MTPTHEQTFFITGANGGIAVEVIKMLVAQRAKRIVLACRTQEKANALKAQMQHLSNQTELVAAGGFDMNDITSIHESTNRLSLSDPIDVVFLQSGGVVLSDRFEFVSHAPQKVEKTVFQNAIGGFVTYQALVSRGLVSEKAKVVFAGGEGARGIPGIIPKPVFESEDEFRRYLQTGERQYSFMRAIGVSKLSSALLVQKLASQADGKRYVWFSPGLTGGTQGLDNVPNPRRFFMKHIGFPIAQVFGLAQNPVQAAQKYVACLLDGVGENGDILGAPEGKALGRIVDQRPMNPALTNHQLRDSFWQIANSISRFSAETH